MEGACPDESSAATVRLGQALTILAAYSCATGARSRGSSSFALSRSFVARGYREISPSRAPCPIASARLATPSLA